MIYRVVIKSSHEPPVIRVRYANVTRVFMILELLQNSCFIFFTHLLIFCGGFVLIYCTPEDLKKYDLKRTHFEFLLKLHTSHIIYLRKRN